MSVVVIGAPVGDGAGVRGAEAGAMALRGAGLLNRLRQQGRAVEEAGDLVCQPLHPLPGPAARLKAPAGISAWSRTIHEAVSAIPADRLPILLGGDHSLSLGSVPGLAERAARLGRPFFVLWVDAHPDCHTLASTGSGHLHGTPVAYALGEADFAPLFPAVAAPLASENLMMLGIRSIDEAEAALIARRRLTVHDPAGIRQKGLPALLAPFLEAITAVNGLLHVSLDADVLDPSVAPGVGTPVDDGLSLAEVNEIMGLVADSGTLASLDLVEVNPFLDRDQRTARAMVELAATAVGARTDEGVATLRRNA